VNGDLSTDFLDASDREVREWWDSWEGRHHLDLTREELFALGEHLGRGPLWTMSPRVTVGQAIAFRLEFRRALPPHTMPELGSPLWYAMMKVNRLSGIGCVHHRNVHDLMFTMGQLGGSWISLDDPVEKDLGFAREDGSLRQAVYLTRYKETWAMYRHRETGYFVQREWDVPAGFRKLMGTPSGRVEVARILSSGDHCLEFPFEVPPVVQRYISNGGRF